MAHPNSVLRSITLAFNRPTCPHTHWGHLIGVNRCRRLQLNCEACCWSPGSNSDIENDCCYTWAVAHGVKVDNGPAALWYGEKGHAAEGRWG
jgi:hypothetical protein